MPRKVTIKRKYPKRNPQTGRRSLSQRYDKEKALKVAAKRHQAYVLFSQEATQVEVARHLGISVGTAHGWHKQYQLKIARKVARRPDFFDQILEHTFAELDILREQSKELWSIIAENKPRGEPGTEDYEPGSPGIVISAIAALHKNNAQRQQLKRLLDTRIEITTKVEMARQRQNRILRFMEENLCPHCADLLKEQFENEFAEITARDKQLRDLSRRG